MWAVWNVRGKETSTYTYYIDQGMQYYVAERMRDVAREWRKKAQELLSK